MRTHSPSSSAPTDSTERLVATGFDLEPLPTDDVLIQFFADDGKTINAQVITREALARLPVVVHAFFLVVDQGQDAALAFLSGVTAREGELHDGDDEKSPNRSGGDQ